MATRRRFLANLGATLVATLAKTINTALAKGSSVFATYNIVTDFGAVGNGVIDDSRVFLDFQIAHSASKSAVRLVIPEGTFKLKFPATKFLQGFKRIEVLGKQPIGDQWLSKVNENFFVIGSPIRETNLRSVRIEAAAQRATVLTVKDRDISGTRRTLARLMRLFKPGKYIAVTEYDLQQQSFPPNAAFFEFKKIVSVGVNTITIESGLSRAYSDLTPEYNIGTSVYCDQGGPATVYALENFYDIEIEVKNIEFSADGNHGFAQGGRNITFTNCNFVNGCWPSATSRTVFQDCKMVTTEVDKVMEYIEFNNCTTTGSVICQSYQPTKLVIRDSTLYALNGTNSDILVENTMIQNTTRIGPGSYGWGKKAVFTGCVHNGSMDLAARSNSLVGATFESGGIIRGFQMEIGSKSGTPNVGQTLTGASSGVTATVAAIHPNYPWLMLSDISGTFTLGEDVSTGTMTGVHKGNIFGHEWCGEGAKLIFATQNCPGAFVANVVSYYRDGQDTVIETDAAAWPNYDDGALLSVFPHYCPDFTMTDCTGNDYALVWSQAPANIPVCSWTRFWLKDDGTILTPPPIYGQIVSIIVEVTKAYTGTLPNLYLAMSQFGIIGLRLPDGFYTTDNADRLDVRVDLKTTGRRVFSIDGNTGIQSADVADEIDFIIKSISPIFMTTSTGLTAYTGLPGESSSVWPEFTATIVTNL